MKEYLINNNDSGQRLDKYLTKALPTLPQSLMHKYVRLKRVKVNGKKSEINYKLQVGDILQLYINDEFFEKPDPAEAWRTVTSRVNIIYEDEHVLLCDKAPGMVVHEDESDSPDTLINHIKSYLFASGAWHPESEASFVPSLCNRIDRNTGGIVIGAKTAAALRVMNEKIKEREISKSYLCLIHGVPVKKSGTLEHFLARDMNEKRVIVYDRPRSDTKTAKMKYTVLESRKNISLVECQLFTGRTHQIRAQMAHIGHPLVGDTKYGTAAQNRSNPFSYQALYSYKLTFDFPTDAGVLTYLKGKTFEAHNIFFMDYFKSL